MVIFQSCRAHVRPASKFALPCQSSMREVWVRQSKRTFRSIHNPGRSLPLTTRRPSRSPISHTVGKVYRHDGKCRSRAVLSGPAPHRLALTLPSLSGLLPLPFMHYRFTFPRPLDTGHTECSTPREALETSSTRHPWQCSPSQIAKYGPY